MHRDNHLGEKIMQRANSFGARLREVMEEKGITQSALRDITGIKQQTISYLLHPDSPATGSKHYEELAVALGVSPQWLKTGLGDKYPASQQSREVPVLLAEHVQAYMETGASSNIRGVVIADGYVSDKAFAIELSCSAMVPQYTPGDRVIVDPEVPAVPGDAVVAIQSDDGPNGPLVFGKFRATSLRDFEVKPSNDDYQTVPGKSVKLVGPVVEHRRYLKPAQKP